MGRGWQQSEIDRLLALHANGVSDHQITVILGRARASVSTKRRDLGLPAMLRPRWSRADIEEAKKLRRGGLTCRQIAALIGRSCEAVTSLFRDLNRGKRRGARRVTPIGPRHPTAERPKVVPIKGPPELVASEQLRVATITAIARYAAGRQLHIDDAAAVLLSGRRAA